MIFVIIVAIIAASIVATQQQTTRLNSQAQIAQDIQSRANNLVYVSGDYFLYQDNQDLSLWQTEFSAISLDLSKLSVSNSEQKTLLSTIEADAQRLNSSWSSVVSYLQSVPRTLAVRAIPVFQDIWSTMSSQNQALIFNAQELSQNFKTQVDQSNFTNIILISALLGLFGAYFVVNYFITYRNTLNSISELQDGIAVIGSGNLDHSLKAGNNDEISEISGSVNQMAANLKTVTASKADLEKEIEERRMAEEKLRGSEENYRHLLEYAPTAIFEIDNTTPRFLNVNDGTCKMIGYTREELLSMNPFNILEAESAELFKERIKRGLAGERISESVEFKVITKDGRHLDVLLYVKPEYKEGKLDRALVVGYDITERKNAEEKLETQAELIDLDPDAILVIKTDGTITFWSKGAEKLYGYSAQEAMGKISHDLLRTTFPAGFALEKILLQIKNIGEWSGELVHRTKYGREVFVQSNWISRINKSGEREFLESNVDVTGQKDLQNKLEERAAEVEEYATRMEELVEERTKKLELTANYARKLIEASLDPLVTISADGKITDVNSATEAVTGYTREEIIGSNFLNYFTEPEKAEAGYKKVFNDGFVRDYPLAIRHKSGKITNVLYNASLYTNEAGEIQGVFAAARDVTEMIKAEEKVREASLYSRSLLEASPDPLVTISADGKITDVNKATEDVTGCTREQLIGSDFSDYFTNPEEARKGYQQVFSEGFVKDYPLAIRHKSGKITCVLYNAALYRNEQGQIQGVFAAARDITERKKAEELARESERKLKDAERLAAIGATAGMVGHDIRNPLQAIISDLYLAKTELEALPENELKANTIESLDEIEKNIDYINKIVADLQDYARPLNPRAQESNIKAVVKETLAKNGVPKNIKVAVKAENDVQTVMADPDYLKRIVGNLVLNAIQAMPEGGKLSVRILKDKQTGEVLLTVEDTGVGILDDVKGKLFTPMVTTKAKGQGFGLPVVKRMTEALGGTVTFESKLGKGTKFIVRLPQKSG
jgi:PAS domain S-box-containing protein